MQPSEEADKLHSSQNTTLMSRMPSPPTWDVLRLLFYSPSSKSFPMLFQAPQIRPPFHRQLV